MFMLKYFLDSLESFDTARETIEGLISEGFSMEDILYAYYSNRYNKYFVAREAWMEKGEELKVFEGCTPSKRTLFFAKLFSECDRVAVVSGDKVKIYNVEELYAGIDPKIVTDKSELLREYCPNSKILVLTEKELQEELA